MAWKDLAGECLRFEMVDDWIVNSRWDSMNFHKRFIIHKWNAYRYLILSDPRGGRLRARGTTYNAYSVLLCHLSFVHLPSSSLHLRQPVTMLVSLCWLNWPLFISWPDWRPASRVYAHWAAPTREEFYTPSCDFLQCRRVWKFKATGFVWDDTNKIQLCVMASRIRTWISMWSGDTRAGWVCMIPGHANNRCHARSIPWIDFRLD